MESEPSQQSEHYQWKGKWSETIQRSNLTRPNNPAIASAN